MKRTTKKNIYAAAGIQYDSKTQKIYHSVLGWIRLPLINGNSKIGKDCYHFSTLAGTEAYTVYINLVKYEIKGTCVCDCEGCYAKTGRYPCQSVRDGLGMRTWLARNDINFLENAIAAQIIADKVEKIRIHAAGDFCSLAYLEMWQRIVARFPAVVFWTYTKVSAYEACFDCFDNANIVKSVIRGYGFNFGHADYIIKLYNLLKQAGKTVHICRCGIDHEQHCTNCTACSKCEYVLFLEHGTDYEPEKDPAFPAFIELVEQQEKEYLTV